MKKFSNYFFISFFVFLLYYFLFYPSLLLFRFSVLLVTIFRYTIILFYIRNEPFVYLLVIYYHTGVIRNKQYLNLLEFMVSCGNEYKR